MPRNARTSDLSTPLTRPCCVMTTASATAIGAPQAHASTSPSRVDRASRYGIFLAIIAVTATNTSAVVARADRPKVRYSITASLQCAVSWTDVLRPDTQLHRSGTLRPAARELRDRVLREGRRVLSPPLQCPPGG